MANWQDPGAPSSRIKSEPMENHSPSTESRVREMLQQTLTREQVAQRSGPGGAKITYFPIEQAVNVSNDIFGYNGWSSSVIHMEKDYETCSDSKWEISYTAQVRVTLLCGAYHEDIGCGKGISRQRYDAIDTARKSASSDGLKRALRLFGNQLGNSIRDKAIMKTSRVTQQLNGNSSTSSTAGGSARAAPATGHQNTLHANSYKTPQAQKQGQGQSAGPGEGACGTTGKASSGAQGGLKAPAGIVPTPVPLQQLNGPAVTADSAAVQEQQRLKRQQQQLQQQQIFQQNLLQQQQQQAAGTTAAAVMTAQSLQQLPLPPQQQQQQPIPLQQQTPLPLQQQRPLQHQYQQQQQTSLLQQQLALPGVQALALHQQRPFQPPRATPQNQNQQQQQQGISRTSSGSKAQQQQQHSVPRTNSNLGGPALNAPYAPPVAPAAGVSPYHTSVPAPNEVGAAPAVAVGGPQCTPPTGAAVGPYGSMPMRSAPQPQQQPQQQYHHQQQYQAAAPMAHAPGNIGNSNAHAAAAAASPVEQPIFQYSAGTVAPDGDTGGNGLDDSFSQDMDPVAIARMYEETDRLARRSEAARAGGGGNAKRQRSA